MRPNWPKITVHSNRPKSHTSHPLYLQRLYLFNFKSKISLPRLGESPLSSATPSYPLSPKITKQTIHQLPTGHICSISSCISTFFGGWGGVVIINLKANLNSTGTGTPTGTELGNKQVYFLEIKAKTKITNLLFFFQMQT